MNSQSPSPLENLPDAKLPLKSIDDVVEALSKNEICEHLHQNIELKADWSMKHGAKISALANRVDQLVGFVVVGVRDDGVPAYKDEKWAKETEEVISQHINKCLDPLQTCTALACRNIGIAWFIVIEIKNAGEVTYWGDHAYAKSGTTIQAISPEDVLKLRIQLPGSIDYTK